MVSVEYTNYKDKRYVPTRQNEFVWLNDPETNSPVRVLIFHLASAEEKKKYIAENESGLESWEELDKDTIHKFMEQNCYVALLGETERILVDTDHIIAPAFNENREPVDILGNVLTQDGAVQYQDPTSTPGV